MHSGPATAQACGTARVRARASITCLKGGVVITELAIKGGLRNGFETYVDRERERCTSYRDGEKHGEARQTEHGRLVAVEMFDAGRQVWSKKLFESGRLNEYSHGNLSLSQTEDGRITRLRCSPSAADDEVMRTPCGFPAAQTTSIYDGTGKVARIETYKDGLIQKLAPGDSDYARRVEVSFIDGKKHGEERQFSKDGKLVRLAT